MFRRFCSILTALAAVTTCSAQQDTSFSVLASVGGGFGVNISQEILLPKGSDNRGPVGTLRLMWKPDHRLRVGLETGWLRLTSASGVLHDSAGAADYRSLELDGVPMMVLFSMNFGRLSLNAGAGYYLLFSYLRGRGDGARSTQWNYGITASVEYMVPVTSSLQLGGGVGAYGITQLGQYVAALQLRAQYCAFEW